MFLHTADLQKASQLVYKYMNRTPEYIWPLLNQHTGGTTWVKHENHGPTGSFKNRGAITFMDWLTRTQPNCKGIVTATRGNHGQGLARAATSCGLEAHIYVPFGNSRSKNQAMQGFGAQLNEFGVDYDESRMEAQDRVQREEGLFYVPPFHEELVRGVATYAYELLTTAPIIDTVYVPIGGGSGVCGTILARNALGLSTKVVGVVADQAPTAKLSVEADAMIETATPKTFADGMALRVPIAPAFAIYKTGLDRIVSVSEDEIAQAVRLFFECTHNVAEGAGAAPLAALMQEREQMKGKETAVILCGGNIDTEWFTQILQGTTPEV